MSVSFVPKGGRVEAIVPFACLAYAAADPRAARGDTIGQIGQNCKRQRGNHDAGTLCQPFFQTGGVVADEKAWGRTCDECMRLGRHRLHSVQERQWDPQWNGKPTGATVVAQRPFPCVSPQCSSRNIWHDRGSVCQPCYDGSLYSLDDTSRWQRSCTQHAKFVGSGEARDVADDEALQQEFMRIDATVPGRAVRLGTNHARTKNGTESAGAMNYEGTQPQSRNRSHDSAGGAAAKLTDAEQKTLDESEEEEQRDDAEPSTSKCASVPFLTANDERALGFELWQRSAHSLPRVDHHGYLNTPKENVAKGDKRLRPVERVGSAYLEQLTVEFPDLPFIKQKDAALSAKDVFARHGKNWTEQAKLEARDCFITEANGIQGVVVMPEVTHHAVLCRDPKYNVKQPNGVIDCASCKLPCVTCGINDFILMGGMNIHADGSKKFAYGVGSATMVFSRTYHCVNPLCKAVQKKHENNPAALAMLRAYLHTGQGGYSIFSANAKIGELQKLGVQFFGHDTRALMDLPTTVCAATDHYSAPFHTITDAAGAEKLQRPCLLERRRVFGRFGRGAHQHGRQLQPERAGAKPHHRGQACAEASVAKVPHLCPRAAGAR